MHDVPGGRAPPGSDPRPARTTRPAGLAPALPALCVETLGGGWAACGWGYALVRDLVNDRIERLAYRGLDRAPDSGMHGPQEVFVVARRVPAGTTSRGC